MHAFLSPALHCCHKYTTNNNKKTYDQIYYASTNKESTETKDSKTTMTVFRSLLETKDPKKPQTKQLDWEPHTHKHVTSQMSVVVHIVECARLCMSVAHLIFI